MCISERITVPQGLKIAGIAKKTLLQLEESYEERFGAPMPLPKYPNGDRYMTRAWALWLREVVALRRRHVGWLETLLELKPIQPHPEALRLPVAAGSGFEDL